MVIDILHQDPLRSNGHWFPYVYIKTRSKAMVIDFLLFISRPFAKEWSLISYVTSRPSTRQLSLISLHQDPLRGNGHWFLMSHRGPLRGNGHWSLYINTLCEAMVIDFLCHIEALYEAMVINLFTSRPSTRQWSLISLSDWGPLRNNCHWSISFWYIASPRDWSNPFFFFQKVKK